MANITFIGLGHMGLPMANHLQQAGHTVIGFDLQEQARDAFVCMGGQVLINLHRLNVDEQDVIVTMLQTGEQVQKILCGTQGLFERASSSTLFIDCSSIAVNDAQMLHTQAQQYGLDMVDAPVSGGVAGAKAASLTMMVGGTTTAYQRAKPYLAAMGKTLIHAGEAGCGQAAKLCNNMILGISMIAVSEAFLLAQKLGLTPQKLHEVVTHSSGSCWVMNQYVPVPDVLPQVPANQNYQPGFTSAMMLKDLRLSQDAAQHATVTTALGEHATMIYEQMNAAGMSQQDFSAVFEFLQNKMKN